MTVRELIDKLEAMAADPDGPEILDREIVMPQMRWGDLEEVVLDTIEITMSQYNNSLPVLLFRSEHGRMPAPR